MSLARSFLQRRAVSIRSGSLWMAQRGLTCSHTNNNNNNPLDTLVQGFQAVKTTIVNNTPLRHVTKPTMETLPFTGKAANWHDAVREAQGLVHTGNDHDRMMDPAKLLGDDVWELKDHIKRLLGSGHPFMKTLVKHYLASDTERIRPLVVQLMALASSPDQVILDQQRRLGEISEMIYISSLLHYDILDDNGEPANVFGNKMAVLGGDFLLARASLALAQLRNAECIELMATCIANLVEGEVLHLKKNNGKVSMDDYLQQCYLKTASLIAQSCKSSVVLGGNDDSMAQQAYEYGRNLGMALQLTSDIQQFAKASTSMDRAPVLSPPLLFAAEEIPELNEIIDRQFEQADDLEKTRLLVYQSQGLKRTFDLIHTHQQAAVAVAEQFKPSQAQQSLVQLAQHIST